MWWLTARKPARTPTFGGCDSRRTENILPIGTDGSTQPRAYYLDDKAMGGKFDSAYPPSLSAHGPILHGLPKGQEDGYCC